MSSESLFPPPPASGGIPAAEGHALFVPEPSAARSGAAHLRFWLFAVAGLTLDLWSKDWAFSKFRQGGGESVIPHVLEFHTMLNPGALFGIGRGQTTLFIVASILALVLVVWMFVQSAARRWVLHLALGGILAGALGNMYDRIFVRLVPHPMFVNQRTEVRFFEKTERGDGAVQLREYPAHDSAPGLVVPREAKGRLPDEAGHVRDFIKINTKVGGKELWPWVFNVADVLLVVGVGLLAIQLWRERKSPAPQPAEPRDSPAATLDSSTPSA